MDTMELDFNIDSTYNDNYDYYDDVKSIDFEVGDMESDFGIEQYDEDFINSL